MSEETVEVEVIKRTKVVEVETKTKEVPKEKAEKLRGHGSDSEARSALQDVKTFPDDSRLRVERKSHELLSEELWVDGEQIRKGRPL